MRVALTMLVVLCVSPALADESAESRAARFYAEGLEVPLLQLRTGSMLIEACTQRLPRACDEQQRQLASQSKVLSLLDALTLFPQRPAADPAAGITKPAQLREKIGETSARLLREAGEYDQHLFARYGATLRVCPDDDDGDGVHRATLSGLMHASYGGFRALRPDALRAAIEATSREEEAAARKLRELSAEDCVTTRRVGEYLMQLMNYKLKLWDEPPPRSPSNELKSEFNFESPRAPKVDAKRSAAQEREMAHAVAGNFISVVATELQLLVYPESATRIKQIAAENGFPEE